jgi:hypothetical protein
MAMLRSDGWLVSVVYFRAAYTPRDFPSSAEWDALWLLESSHAIKCPTVAYHLAGSKKVQQAIAAPGVLEKWIMPSEAARIRSGADCARAGGRAELGAEAVPRRRRQQSVGRRAFASAIRACRCAGRAEIVHSDEEN